MTDDKELSKRVTVAREKSLDLLERQLYAVRKEIKSRRLLGDNSMELKDLIKYEDSLERSLYRSGVKPVEELLDED